MARDVARRAVAWTLCFLAGCAVALPLVSLAIVRALDAAGEPKPFVELELVELQLATLEKLAQRDEARPELRVAFLGDSTSMHFKDRTRGIDSRLEAELAAFAPERADFRVISFATPGYTPFSYYFLSERVADAGADAVVIAFNLAAFSEQWRKSDRAERAALLPLPEVAAALRLPLDWIGLSLDRLLLYPTIVRLGGIEAWRRAVQEQARCARAWESLALWLETRSGSQASLALQVAHFATRRGRALLPGKRDRETAELARTRLAVLLAGAGPEHPVLRILRAALEVFQSHHIPVLVYVVPLNIEHFERLGVDERAGLLRGVERVRSVVLAGGAAFLDLHDQLPDADFADSSGHLAVGDAQDAPTRVARSIARALATAADASR